MLTADELRHFAEQGYVHVNGAIPTAVAAKCRELALAQLDLAAGEPVPEPVVRGVVDGEPLREAASAPLLLDAIHQLLDPDDWVPRPNLGFFVVRFPSEHDPGDAGWHIDSSFDDGSGAWFVNYRSRERGLLLLSLLSDVGVDDAPTRIQCGSHRRMPVLLEPFGEEGVFGLDAPLPEPEAEVALATGAAGDVYVCHPFLVHAASWPHRGSEPRFVAQPPIALRGALQLDGAVDGLSVVARTVRAGLGHS